jgi:uncharacterized protein YdiU (UPF0061 family)
MRKGPCHKALMREKNFIPIYELGSDFYDEVEGARFPKGILRYRNQDAATEIGLDSLTPSEWQEHFWGFKSLPDNIQKPLALRYHGHQFGTYNPELGDGRGFLFAQFRKNKLYDLGTKGSGQTPYSRQGDGRLTLKGAFREALCTELLESLGVNTSRTFSIFETGESLERNDEPSPTRAGILFRLSHGHIRIGTFQRLAYLKETENIKKLTDYCIRHYYPEIPQDKDAEEKAALFLIEVTKKCAELVASYMMAGFVHGVLNTDNINITGESFDYGPYRFLPFYDTNFTAAYFDQRGFYCFGRQPGSFLWSLDRLARSLAVAFPNLPYKEILENFGDDFNTEIRRRFLSRLNVQSSDHNKVENLLAKFFEFQDKKLIPFEQIFFDLFGGWNEERLSKSPYSKSYNNSDLKTAFSGFFIKNPETLKHRYFQQEKPETLLIDEIEDLWAPIASDDNWEPFNNKIERLRNFRGIY